MLRGGNHRRQQPVPLPMARGRPRRGDKRRDELGGGFGYGRSCGHLVKCGDGPRLFRQGWGVNRAPHEQTGTMGQPCVAAKGPLLCRGAWASGGVQDEERLQTRRSLDSDLGSRTMGREKSATGGADWTASAAARCVGADSPIHLPRSRRLARLAEACGQGTRDVQA